MLGADFIGFHTHEYNAHFQESVRKTLGFNSHLGYIQTPFRKVKSDGLPVGIDVGKFERALQTSKVVHHIDKIKQSKLSRKMILSVDRLDYTKGITYRLEGFETFLKLYPEWHEKVLLQMIVVPSRDVLVTYKERNKEIEAFVTRINGRYGNIGWQPIVYQYRSLEFDELVANYALSDVGLVTPIRNGMNLVAKEFIASQSEDAPGVLILSEMTGAAPSNSTTPCS